MVANRLLVTADLVVLSTGHGGPFSGATGTTVMRIKAMAAIIVLMLSAALFVQMRKDNRADAAASNCYSEAKGPSTPTVCN